jgi:hypothetical protein
MPHLLVMCQWVERWIAEKAADPEQINGRRNGF